MSRAARLRALESRKRDQHRGPVHSFSWDVGQSWSDALAAYGEDRIGTHDVVIVRSMIAAKDGKPAPDPVRERDRAEAEQWMEGRRIAA